jgi:hypothetical protein
MTAMPELTERKRVIDMHMNIALSIMNIVQERKLDVMFSLEENIQRQNKASVLKILEDLTISKEDKLRLYLVFVLNVEVLSKEEESELENALQKSGCDLGAVRYMKR